MSEPEEKTSGLSFRDKSARKFLSDKKLTTIIICILISTALWFLNALGKTYTTSIFYAVRYINMPENKVLSNDPPSKLELKVTAPGFTIFSYRILMAYSPIVLNLSEVTKNSKPTPDGYLVRTESLIRNISSQMSKDITLTSIDPDYLTFRFDSLLTRTVEIKPVLETNFRQQFNIAGPVRVMPGKVQVKGIRETIDTIKYVLTEKKTFTMLNKTVESKLDLIAPPNTKIQPQTVNIEIPVEEFTEKEILVPVTITNNPPNLGIKQQPLTFQIDTDTFAIGIFSETGRFNIVGQNGEDFPEIPSVNEDVAATLSLSHDVLQKGIEKTLFATADDELRPVMNGIFIEITTDFISFVASDAHKLVRYRRSDAKADIKSSFILPKKPASLLKNLLGKEEGKLKLEFDNKNAVFTMSRYTLICRLVEGNYPSYNSVIPVNNPNKLVIGRLLFNNTVKRVSVFSNQASNLVKLHIADNKMVVSAQDIDFAISAEERLTCDYEGDEMEIGFKSTFLLEILSNLSSGEIRLELSDPTRAGLLLPEEKGENEDLLMLLMPMMINV